MDNPVDHTIDLGLVNYVKHPSNKDYIVYRFADQNRANSFEQALEEEGIWFEKSTKEGKQRDYYLFGVHKHDYSKTEKINYRVEAMHKKPMIKMAFFRYFILFFSLIMLTLATIGYCKAQNKYRLSNEAIQTINPR